MQHKSIANARQGSLQFFLPRPLTAAEFRETCSLWIDSVRQSAGLTAEQVNAIFNHDLSGRPSNHLSAYRFCTDGNWGFLHALGEDAMALLRRIADRATERSTARISAPRWEDRNVGVVLQSPPIHYWAPEMVVCRNAEQHVRWQRASLADKRAHVLDLVTRSLARQLQMLQLDVEIPAIEITAIKHERAVPRLASSALRANAYVRLAAVAFSLPANLHGHWAVGGLVNRGYGSVLPLHDLEQVEAIASA